ncbi:MAG: HEAT repeat domain-containing protein, partial [Thaumarchaeota archaeon]|nr:HEAT repeat domain-containing protein [Nitrososphaerota archaeon]
MHVALLIVFSTLLATEASETKKMVYYRGKKVTDWVDLLLKSPNELTRCVAAEALFNMSPEVKDALPSLISALNDNSPRVCFWVCRAIAGFGPGAKPAVPGLMKVWERFSLDIVLETLESIGPDAREALPLLIKIVKSKNIKNIGSFTRSQAIKTIGALGPGGRSCDSDLWKILLDKNEEKGVRISSSVGLTKILQRDEIP